MILPSRRLAAAFVCVFVLGAIAGALAYMNLADSRLYNFMNRTNDPAAFAVRIDKRLASQYSLDADEQARIAPLTQNLAQKLYQIRRKFASDVLDAMDDSHKKIADQLTPAQREAYLKDNEIRRKRAAAMLTPGAPAAADAAH